MDNQQNKFPYVEIIEQPASKAIRFRYECEGRFTRSIPGENSEPHSKTWPSIRIVGYEGRAVIVISFVTKDQPYRPHPHSIVGKDVSNHGVYTLELYTHQKPIILTNLGIQCVKKKNVDEALKHRKKIRVDPFKTGFDFNQMCIDLSVVRLCFQVFLAGQNGKFQIPLAPVVSNPIYDKKVTSDLMICKLSHCSAPTSGGMEMIILCEKIVKDNIQVVFYELKDDQVVWQAFGDFTLADVHHQVAISFRTPKYPINVTHPVPVFIQLMKRSDGTTSDPLSFTLIPVETASDAQNSLKRKRQKFNTSGPILTSRVMQNSNALEDQYNQQNLQENGDIADEVELVPLKNVAPSIFTPRFTQNSNSRWNNLGNHASQMSLTNYQEKVTPQPIAQYNPQCIPTISDQPPPSTLMNYSLPLAQNRQMDNHNQAPTLYKIQSPSTPDLLAGLETSIDLNSNHLNFVAHSIDDLKELNSADLAGLSEIFSASFSLADPTEFYQE